MTHQEEENLKFSKKQEALRTSYSLNSKIQLIGVSGVSKKKEATAEKLIADAEKIYKWLNK